MTDRGHVTLDLRDLSVVYRHRDRPDTEVVHDVSLTLRSGRVLGLAGESGSGKSTTALAAIGFPIPGGRRETGTAVLGGEDLFALQLSALRKVWGRRVAYVPQNAASSLNPLRRIDGVFAELLSVHLGLGADASRARTVELLSAVGIPNPEVAIRRYPHQFSGGQQQRIALAIAMSCDPEILLLDEPTTGLDVTTQAQISQLIHDLVQRTGVSALYISHDLALLATICDDLAIMYAGEIVEQGPVGAVCRSPRHPYTAALLDAAPEIEADTQVRGIPGLPPPGVILSACAFAERCGFKRDECVSSHPELHQVAEGHWTRCTRTDELGVVPSQRSSWDLERTAIPETECLQVSDLHCSYPGRQGVTAVDGVSLDIRVGEVVGLVGESGSGKSTLLRAVGGLHRPTAGVIAYRGVPLAARVTDRPLDVRRAIQLVFQHPDSSLNPRHTIGSIIDRPLRLFALTLGGSQRRERVHQIMTDVRLDPALYDRYPAELSGGQKQRVALARAFAADPDLILCDEVVSALDVSVQASILELLADLAHRRGTALLFVTHDLAVVRTIADRIYVMQNGQFCESATTEALFRAPAHPYTRALLAAVPRPATRRGSDHLERQAP